MTFKSPRPLGYFKRGDQVRFTDSVIHRDGIYYKQKWCMNIYATYTIERIGVGGKWVTFTTGDFAKATHLEHSP